MRKYIAFFFIFILLIGVISDVYAQRYIPPETKPTSLQEVLLNANLDLGFDYFEDKNKNQNPLNMSLWNERSILVYGQPKEFNAAAGYHRYLGETFLGEDFTNVYFPHDAWAGGFLETRNWLTRPWGNTQIQNTFGINQNDFNGHLSYIFGIRAGLEQFYEDAFRGDWNWQKPWTEVVHILQPPTYYAWGMGRMWHQTAGGSIFYATVPIAPYSYFLANYYVKDFNPGISTEIIDGELTYIAEAGKSYTATVTFGVKDYYNTVSDKGMLIAAMERKGGNWERKNVSHQSGVGSFETVDGWGDLSGQTVQWVFINTGSTGEGEVTGKFTWTASPDTDKLAVLINLDYPTVPFIKNLIPYEFEDNFDDNLAEIPIKIKEPTVPPPAPGPPAPAPTALDLRVTVANNSSPLQQGQSKTITGTLTNTGSVAQATTYVWRVNGTVVETKNITLQPNSTQNVQRNYTAPLDAPLGQMIVVELEINPNRNQPANEPNWVNNKRQTAFSIIHKTESVPDGGLNNTGLIK